MHSDAESGTPMLSSSNDSRITNIGKFMRKYRIDELPQFWNVIKGDMALVGPRPERPYYINLILKEAPYYTLLHQVRPGITSWGMVKFGYAQTVEEMVERSKYDLLYLSNMSLTMDLKILVFTIRTVITGRGV
jgi:lipopolysaccharide/colanic/teichoic acid biosynthesis glycosyltransferase